MFASHDDIFVDVTTSASIDDASIDIEPTFDDDISVDIPAASARGVSRAAADEVIEVGTYADEELAFDHDGWRRSDDLAMSYGEEREQYPSDKCGRGRSKG